MLVITAEGVNDVEDSLLECSCLNRTVAGDDADDFLGGVLG